MEKKANIALGLFVSAFIVPTLFFAIAKAFSHLRSSQIEQLSFFIFLAFLLGAIVCAVAAGKQKQAIAVLVCSLLIFVAMILFALIPGNPKMEGPKSIQKPQSTQKSSGASPKLKMLPSKKEDAKPDVKKEK